MMAWRIKAWDDLYENNKSREIEMLTYFLQTNKLAGEGVGFMLQQPDGLELYGTFGFIKILASTAPRKLRGCLFRNGTPLTPERMSALTHVPTEKFTRALDFFSTAPMDWLEYVEVLPDGKTPRRHHDDTTTTPAGRHRGTISPVLSTDIGLSTEGELKRKREEHAGFDSKEGARKAQSQQFASAQAQLSKLEGLPEEDRTEVERVEMKKLRRVLKAIQKKQTDGDFTPVKEATP